MLGDEEAVIEFRLEYQLFLEMRSKEKKYREDATRFKDQFFEDMEDFMKEEGEPTDIPKDPNAPSKRPPKHKDNSPVK